LWVDYQFNFLPATLPSSRQKGKQDGYIKLA